MLPPNKEEAETVTLLLTPQKKRRLGVVSRNPRKFRHPRKLLIFRAILAVCRRRLTDFISSRIQKRRDAASGQCLAEPDSGVWRRCRFRWIGRRGRACE